VVTGGSSGIGAAFCRAAARGGWHVWIGYANGGDRAMRIARDMAMEGCSASTAALPLNDPRTLQGQVKRMATSAYPPSAAVLCGAPAPDVSSCLKITAEQFRRQLDSTVIGNHILLTELWRHSFRAQGGGHVLAVLSAAQTPPIAPYMASYVAAKGALETLLHAIAVELGRSGLHVGVIRPGYVETPMLRAFEPRFLARVRDSAPARAFLKPEDIARSLLAGLRGPFLPGVVTELPIAVAEAA
jgi:NAD(P)-dependent dehydrogenase (short-subunit alcohol dehydrogenase family)